MRSVWLLLVAGLNVVASACGGANGSTPRPDARTDRGDLGMPCAGGCVGVDLCTVTDNDCASGHCLADRRSGDLVTYCTADCTNSACPVGFVCEDVPFQLTRACVLDGSQPSGVVASITLAGQLGPHGQTAAPFTVAQSVTILASPNNLPCNSATLELATSSGIRIQVHVCGSVDAFITFTIPARQGPTQSAAVFALLGSTGQNTIARYGDEQDPAPEIDAVVESLSFDDPARLGHLEVNLQGTLAYQNDCPGPACGVASPTLNITANLELTDVAVP